MQKRPGEIWFFLSLASATSPFILGWLESYSVPSLFFESVMQLLLWGGIAGALIWLALSRQAGASWVEIGIMAVIWALVFLGARFVGAWLYLAMWNPDQPPPFMMPEYALAQAVIGLCIWGPALLLFGLKIFRSSVDARHN